MRIVDAHLDLAYNATRGRDPRMPAREQPLADNEIATVGLPDLRAGGVDLICATIFCRPAGYGKDGYTSSEEARAQALSQLSWYRQLHDKGEMKIVKRDTDLRSMPATRHGPEDRVTRAVSAILLLEGADALRGPEAVSEFYDAGGRIIGLPWRTSFYAGVSRSPGPRTTVGRA